MLFVCAKDSSDHLITCDISGLRHFRQNDFDLLVFQCIYISRTLLTFRPKNKADKILTFCMILICTINTSLLLCFAVNSVCTQSLTKKVKGENFTLQEICICHACAKKKNQIILMFLPTCVLVK